MKKILILLLLLCISGCMRVDQEYKTFYNLIKNYQSFNENKLYEYYEKYSETNNIILSLNLINHPNFYQNKYDNPYYDDIILVNKHHPVPNNYIPKDLVKVEDINYIKRDNETMVLNKETLENLKLLFLDAKTNNIDLTVFSAYRSFEKQASLWDGDYSFNNMYKAVPGYSEHQTGLAVDISTTNDGLTNNKTIAYNFLKENAHRYGFILRYPENKETITGYNYEPWHYRYVGNISTFIHQNNLTLEEYIYNYVEIKEK